MFPQSSVAVNVTWTFPVAPQVPSIKEVKLLDHVILLQSSVTEALPFAVSHACNSSVLPSPSHSTVRFEDWILITGAVFVGTVNVAVSLTVSGQALVALQITVAEPPHASGALPELLVTSRLLPPLDCTPDNHWVNALLTSVWVKQASTVLSFGAIRITSSGWDIVTLHVVSAPL